jgi:hypothetical protein
MADHDTGDWPKAVVATRRDTSDVAVRKSPSTAAVLSPS